MVGNYAILRIPIPSALAASYEGDNPGEIKNGELLLKITELAQQPHRKTELRQALCGAPIPVTEVSPRTWQIQGPWGIGIKEILEEVDADSPEGFTAYNGLSPTSADDEPEIKLKLLEIEVIGWPVKTDFGWRSTNGLRIFLGEMSGAS